MLIGLDPLHVAAAIGAAIGCGAAVACLGSATGGGGLTWLEGCSNCNHNDRVFLRCFQPTQQCNYTCKMTFLHSPIDGNARLSCRKTT